MELLKELSDAIEKRKKCVLVIIVNAHGSTPRSIGTKMIVYDDGHISGTIGGGSLEKFAIEKATEVMRSGTPVTMAINLEQELDMNCGGNVELFFEPFSTPDALLIFGGGHIGKSLVPLARSLGFMVTVIDDRAEFASAEQHPEADKCVHGDVLDFCRNYPFSGHDWVVIVTHNHTHDQRILEYVVRKPCRYIGMIGSKRKALTARELLRAQGIEESVIAAIKSPIGFGIKAETPREIAVLIAGELVQHRYMKNDA